MATSLTSCRSNTLPFFESRHQSNAASAYSRSEFRTCFRGGKPLPVECVNSVDNWGGVEPNGVRGRKPRFTLRAIDCREGVGITEIVRIQRNGYDRGRP